MVSSPKSKRKASQDAAVAAIAKARMEEAAIAGGADGVDFAVTQSTLKRGISGQTSRVTVQHRRSPSLVASSGLPVLDPARSIQIEISATTATLEGLLNRFALLYVPSLPLDGLALSISSTLNPADSVPIMSDFDLHQVLVGLDGADFHACVTSSQLPPTSPISPSGSCLTINTTTAAAAAAAAGRQSLTGIPTPPPSAPLTASFASSSALSLPKRTLSAESMSPRSLSDTAVDEQTGAAADAAQASAEAASSSSSSSSSSSANNSTPVSNATAAADATVATASPAAAAAAAAAASRTGSTPGSPPMLRKHIARRDSYSAQAAMAARRSIHEDSTVFDSTGLPASPVRNLATAEAVSEPQRGRLVRSHSISNQTATRVNSQDGSESPTSPDPGSDKSSPTSSAGSSPNSTLSGTDSVSKRERRGLSSFFRRKSSSSRSNSLSSLSQPSLSDLGLEPLGSPTGRTSPSGTVTASILTSSSSSPSYNTPIVHPTYSNDGSPVLSPSNSSSALPVPQQAAAAAADAGSAEATSSTNSPAAAAAASTTSTGTGGSPNSGRKFLFRANTSKGRKSSAGALDLTSGSGTARSKDFIPGTTPAATMDFESLPRIVAPGAEFTYTNPETQITYRTDRDEVLVMTATFERLIDCMTEDIDKDVDYSDTFFLTYKSFLKPIVLFEALVAKFKGTGNAGAAAQIAAAGPDGQPPLQSAGSVESVSDASATMTSAVGGSQTDIFGMSATGSSTLKLKSSTRPKVLTMILHWMKHHWMDVEEDPVLQEQVHTFLNGLREGEYTAYYQSINNAVQQQRQRWEERKLQGEDASELLKRTSTKLSKMLPKIVIEMEPKELAEQLTYYDHHIFSRISRNDYINYLWPSKSRKEQLKASTNQTGTSHLDAFVNRLEKETFWIATEICSLSENETLKEQAKLIQLFLQALSHCLALDNIYTCFAIYGALNFQPVQKLKKAWELVPKKYLAPLQEVENLMNPSRNMRAYRTFIHQKEKTTTPLLPFLPLHLKDLVFLNDGNDTFFQDGRVNFDKCRTIARRVDWLDKLANRPYSWIVPKPELQSYLESAYVCPNMDELTKLARKNNPPPPAPASSSSTMKP